MRVLIVGLGGVGQRHVRNLRAIAGDSLELTAWRNRRLSRTLTDQLQVEPGFDVEKKYGLRCVPTLDAGLAERPDAVLVCNPSSLHVPVAIAAAHAGCHVLIEKPLSHSLDGVEDLVRTLRERKRVGLVAYQLRFHPLLARLREIVVEGLVGRPVAARVEVGEWLPGWHPYEDYREIYAARRDLGGGVVLSQIHELDYLQWLFGRPRRVFAMGGHLSRLEIDVEDVAQMSLEFRVSGAPCVVQVHADYLQRPPGRSCLVLGDAGKALLDFRGPTLKRWDAEGELVEDRSLPGFQRNELFLAEMRHFLGCVEGREQPRVPLEQGATSLETALAVRDSLESGRVVELEP